MTPWWVTLLTGVLAALIAGGFTLAGVVLTQRSSAERDAATADREERARTFTAKQEAYVAFLTAGDAARSAASVEELDSPDDRAKASRLLVDFDERMAGMQLFAPPEVLAKAYKVSEVIRDLVHGPLTERAARDASVHDVVFDLQQVIRADLGVPPLQGDPDVLAG